MLLHLAIHNVLHDQNGKSLNIQRTETKIKFIKYTNLFGLRLLFDDLFLWKKKSIISDKYIPVLHIMEM
jgi:hypothetical protein